MNPGKPQTPQVHGPIGMLVLMACLASPGISAEEDHLSGHVALGATHANLDHPSVHYGENNPGVSDDKTWLTGELDLKYRPEKNYLTLSASSRGADNQQLRLTGGTIGIFGLEINHGEQPHLLSVRAHTPFDGVGGDTLTLPTGFVKGANTSQMTNLSTSLKSTALRVDRATDKFRVFATPDANWRLEFGAERYTLTGKQPVAGTVFFTSAAILPAPVDQATNALNMAVNFRRDNIQWGMAYKLSTFHNHVEALVWDNPFNVPSAPLAAPRGRISQAPGNRQQTLGMTGSVELSRANRLTLSAERSRLEQVEDLLPYTINSSVSVPNALPRTSADARIDVSHLNLALLSRPLRNLTINTRYRYHRNKDSTPRALFLPVINDTRSQVTENSRTARYGLPQDSRNSQFKVDGNYHLGSGSTLKIGLRHETEEKRHRAVRKTSENGISGGLAKRFSDRADADINIEHAHRKTDGRYDQLAVYEAAHTESYIATVTDPNLRFDNHPLLWQYDIANRVRGKIAFNISLFPAPDIIAGLHVARAQDDYPGTRLGLASHINRSYTLNVDYTPEASYSLFGYLGRDTTDFVLLGRAFGNLPSGSATTGYDNTNNDWSASHADRLFSTGIGGTRRINDNLAVTIRYARTRGSNAVRFSAGTGLAQPSDLPKSRTARDEVVLSGDYSLGANMTLSMGAVYDRYRGTDWATQGIDAGSNAIANVLTLANPDDGYTAYTLYTTLTYKW